jgi:hypothetical protein
MLEEAMAKVDGAYFWVVVESYRRSGSGLHGDIHVRPISGEKFPSTLHVECSKKLVTDYPVGTRFRIKAKLTDRLGDGEFLYSYYGWQYEVIKDVAK